MQKHSCRIYMHTEYVPLESMLELSGANSHIAEGPGDV